MTTSQQARPILTSEQRRLVAIGASIGVGCQPCLHHHITAARKVGMGSAQLLAASASAQRVRAEAAARMAAVIRDRTGDAVGAFVTAAVDEELVCLGAALGANDLTNIEHHVLAAVGLGASRAQLQEAIDLARQVHDSAMGIHRRAAERLLPASTMLEEAGEDAAAGAQRCGCAAATDRVIGADAGGCGCEADTKENPAADPGADADDCGCAPEAVAAVGESA